MRNSKTLQLLRQTKLFCLIALATAAFPLSNAVAQTATAEKEAVEEESASSEELEPTPETAGGEAEFDRELYLKCFEQVWSTIKKSHWDPEVYGERWDEAKARFLPEMEAAESKSEAIQILTDLVGALEQSHFGIIPGRSYTAIARNEKRGGPGFSGLTVRWIEENFTVTHVESGSPAADAGVQPGWSILSVRNGKRNLTAAELAEDAAEATEHGVMRRETALGLAGGSFVSGAVGSKLLVRFDTGADTSDAEATELELELVRGPGEPAKLGNLPTTYVAFQYKELPNAIGYIKFNAFLDPVRLITEYEKALKSESSKNGLVIDLRGNIGGVVYLTMGMCGWLVEEPVSLGTMYMRNTPLRLALNPRRPRYAAPVAVLIDECTISASEMMSGGLKDLGRAKVFGAKSAGLVLPSVVVKLPSGEGFQYAMAGYESASGDELEVNGVVPDVEINPSREELAKGVDPVLAAAMAWLDEQAN